MARPKTGRTAPHVPTDKTRAEVVALVSFGNTQEEIANHIGIDINTLVKYYRNEIDNSVVRANAKVAAKLFRKATDGEDLTAMIFWLKTRARWRETNHDEKSNSDLHNDIIKRKHELDEKNKKEF
jgi:DNA-binding CsgD family transcriptional regulator